MSINESKIPNLNIGGPLKGANVIVTMKYNSISTLPLKVQTYFMYKKLEHVTSKQKVRYHIKEEHKSKKYIA